MNQMKLVSDGKIVTRNIGSTPPPLPPPLPAITRLSGTKKPRIKYTKSVTKQEIDKFWKRKRLVEEDHFNSAIKAAARLRARNLSEEDYKSFVESLTEDLIVAETSDDTDQINKEIRVGVKDWWTKSKYAYLNQPAIKSVDNPKRLASTYLPQFSCYKSAPPPSTTTFGIC